MDDRQARAVTLLEAYEQLVPPSPNWSDDDRRWADRVALETAGVGASADAFVAERARQAMHRLLPRDRHAARWVERRGRFGSWLVVAVVAGLAIGLWPDPFGGVQRVNLLSPPLWGVVAWNVAVYVALLLVAVAAFAGLRRRPDPLRRAITRLVGGSARIDAAMPVDAAPLARAMAMWQQRSARLFERRAATLLHLAAAAIGVGLVAALYLRGLVLDYRVVWESTFLSPGAVYAALSALLAPAAAVTGIALPSAAEITALRDSAAAPAAGAPAARFVHLLAATVLLVVVMPRLVLAAMNGIGVAHGRRRFPIALDSPQHQRLVRLQRGADAEVVVVPYAQTPTPQAVIGVQALLVEAFGPKAVVRVAPTVAFGAADDALPRPDGIDRASHVVALFDLSATPELESQGRFASRLVALLPDTAALALVVDETGFRRRFEGFGDKVEQRRAAWRGMAERLGTRSVFVALEHADAAAASTVADLQAAFATRVQPAADALPARP